MESLCLDKKHITIDEIVEVARENVPVQISPRGEARVAKARSLISRWVREKRVIYGINTGFGALSDVIISTENITQLQENILVSHAAGVGKPLPIEVVRAVMALRIRDLSLGYAGCRTDILHHLVALLTKGFLRSYPRRDR